MKRDKFGYYLAGLVSAITFLIYLPALRNKFVNWDDRLYIFQNPHIRSFDFSFLNWAFFDFYAGNWHPLTWISHAVDYAIWGLNPMGHHLTNNILHAVNAFVVVLLAMGLVEAGRRSGDADGHAPRYSSFTLIAGATTGLLFGLHPLHVESVAWVSERKDLLCGLFFLLSIMSYTKYAGGGTLTAGESHDSPLYPPSSPLREKGEKKGGIGVRAGEGYGPGRGKWYVFSLLFFIFALMSKPMAVSLPFVLLILDWYPYGRLRSLRTFRTVLVEKLPFIALSIASSIVTLLAQEAGRAMGNAPLPVRMAVAFNSLLSYAWKMILPLNLLPFYPFPERDAFSYSHYVLPAVLVIAISVTCIFLAKRAAIFTAVWCYYVVTLLPVIGIVQVGLQAMADRYTYLPSLGPFLIAGVVAALGAKKVESLKKWKRGGWLVFSVSMIFMFVPLSYLTIKQTAVWKNGVSLWSYIIEKEPGVALGHVNRGMNFLGSGQLDRAVSDFSRAISLDPSNRTAYYGRGLAYERKGDFDRAIADYKMTISLNSSLADVLVRLGILYGKTGSLEKAIGQFDKALAIDPGYSLAYFNRGFAYSLTGQEDRALIDFNKAIELNGSYGNALYGRGRLYLRRGDKGLAASDFRRACVLGNKEGCDSLKALNNGK